MSSPQPATVRRDRSRSSQPRARRVLSERLAARREKVLEHLVNPPIVAETAELLTTQANDIYRAFKPRNGWQDWLTSEIAVIMVRINRCSRIERKLRDYASYRAIDFWEEDQALAVETLAAKLGATRRGSWPSSDRRPPGATGCASAGELLARVEPDRLDRRAARPRRQPAGGDPTPTRPAPGSPPEQVAELTASASGSKRPTRSSGGWSRPTSATRSRAWPGSGATRGRSTAR